MNGTDGELLERADIQGLILRGYSNLRAARYYLLRIEDPRAFQQWLGKQLKEDAISTAAKRHDAEVEAFNLAFTAEGLRKLGVNPDDSFERRDSFSLEFRQGLVEPERSRFLGDVGPNDPAEWLWGGLTSPTEKEMDCLCLTFARHHEDAPHEVGTPIRRFWDRVGPPAEAAVVVRQLEAFLPKDEREPFGFKDGISQPILRFTKRDYVSAGADRRLHVVEPGEFLFGYPNQLGSMPLSPWVRAERDVRGRLRPVASSQWAKSNGASTLRDFGRNGTYLVFRQLEQHVDAFRKFLKDAAAASGQTPDLLAARMVGRWPSGTPLTISPKEDRPLPEGQLNAFGFFDEDRYGYRCPLGSHIRRGNPRDVSAEIEGPDEALWTSNLHRLIRRGRVYAENGSCGLMFLCLNADLRRQFEFVQQHWIYNQKFGGLSDERDPLVGDLNQFTIQAVDGYQCIGSLQRFVTVRGGAYFFMPSMAALSCLADEGVR